MTVHYVDVYHCQKCGRVTNCEPNAQVPQCCGEPMAQAVSNMSYEQDHSEVSSRNEEAESSHPLDPSKRK